MPGQGRHAGQTGAMDSYSATVFGGAAAGPMESEQFGEQVAHRPHTRIGRRRLWRLEFQLAECLACRRLGASERRLYLFAIDHDTQASNVGSAFAYRSTAI
jgi:hypothetical protein